MEQGNCHNLTEKKKRKKEKDNRRHCFIVSVRGADKQNLAKLELVHEQIICHCRYRESLGGETLVPRQPVFFTISIFVYVHI